MVVQYEKSCTPFKFLELCRCSTVGVWLRTCSSAKLPRPRSFNCTSNRQDGVRRRNRSSRSVGTSVAFDENKESPTNAEVLNKRRATIFDPSVPIRRETLATPSPVSSNVSVRSPRGLRNQEVPVPKQVFYPHELQSVYSSPNRGPPIATFDSEKQFSSSPQFINDQYPPTRSGSSGSSLVTGSRNIYREYSTSWGYNQNALLLYQSSIQSKWHSPYLSDGCATEPLPNNLSCNFEPQSAPNLVENFCNHHQSQALLSPVRPSNGSSSQNQPVISSHEKQPRTSNQGGYKTNLNDLPDDTTTSCVPLYAGQQDTGNYFPAFASPGNTCARHSRQWTVCENHQKQHNITSSNFGHWYFNQALTAAASSQNYLSPVSSHFPVTQQGDVEELMISSVQSLPENSNSRAYKMNKQVSSFSSDRQFDHAVQIPFGGNSRYAFHNPEFNHPRRPTSRAPSLNKHLTLSSLPPVEENLPVAVPPRQSVSGNERESPRRTSGSFLVSRELPYANSRRANSIGSGTNKSNRDQNTNSSCPVGDHLVATCISCLSDTQNSPDESTSIWKLRQPPPLPLPVPIGVPTTLPSRAAPLPGTPTSEPCLRSNESTEWATSRELPNLNTSRLYRSVTAAPTKDPPKKPPANIYQHPGLFNKELDLQSSLGDKRTSKSPARLIASSSRVAPCKTASVQLPVRQQHSKSSQDIWVRQAEIGVKETDILSTCGSASSITEEESEMAPQRSFKIIDPCLHSPIHPAYRTADMKQSRTSVSIQNDSYNFGPPASRAMGRITTTQSISGLDSYNSESPESEEILPLNELYGAWGSDVDDIVTSYEKLDIEEKTSPRSKFNDVWTGRNQMKPPPFKTAVASLNSLRMSSNFNLADCNSTSVDMASQNAKRFATSLVDINEKTSISSHPGNCIQKEKSIIEARKVPSSNLFTTQSELNVTVNRKDSIPQNNLKNCRSELLLAETLTSVKNLSLRPRDRSKPNLARSASHKTKSSNDISNIGELAISDEFSRGFSRSKYRQSLTSSTRLRSTSLHSGEIKEENEEMAEEQAEKSKDSEILPSETVSAHLQPPIPFQNGHLIERLTINGESATNCWNKKVTASTVAAFSYQDGAITNKDGTTERDTSAAVTTEKQSSSVVSAEEKTPFSEEDVSNTNTYMFEESNGTSSKIQQQSPQPSTNSAVTGDKTCSTVHSIAPALQAVSDALSSLESVSFHPEKKPRVYRFDGLAEEFPKDPMDDSADQMSQMDALNSSMAMDDAWREIPDLYEVADPLRSYPQPDFASIEEYPEFTGEENQRDLSIAFAEFSSAISGLITIADTDKPLQNLPSPQHSVKKKPTLPKIHSSPLRGSPEAYDVTPTNEREEPKLINQSSSSHFQNYNSLYSDLDMKVEEFLQNCPPGKSIEFLLEKLTRPKSIHVYQKLIGRSKSLPGSLNETANVGKLRPLRVPRQLKSHWDARLRRRSPESKKSVDLELVGKNLIPRRHKSKRKFLRDDPDRCKSVPLTKVEIHCLSDHSNTDGISSLPSVTNINELGLYEYVDVDSELNFSMQKMFVNSHSQDNTHLSSTRTHPTPETFLPFQSGATSGGHLPPLLENPILDSSPSPAQHHQANSAIQSSPNEEPVSNRSGSIHERLSTSAASTCANVDVSQLIFELCASDDFSDEYPDDDDEGGGIRDPYPSEFAENDGLKDEYFASELIEPNYQISPKPFPTSLNGLTSQQHPPPVLPLLANARQIIERSATYPRTLDEITECANE